MTSCSSPARSTEQLRTPRATSTGCTTRSARGRVALVTCIRTAFGVTASDPQALYKSKGSPWRCPEHASEATVELRHCRYGISAFGRATAL